MSFTEEEIKDFRTEADELMELAEKSLLDLDRGEALLRRFEEIRCGTWVTTQVRSLHKRRFDHGFWLYPEASGMRTSILEWCDENLGPSRAHPHTRWFEEAYVFWFRSATDATAFKIRWV
ncbi:MAG: hypothetical protein EOP06_18800 [Proteobacteria bacterium]|nr:MAG: hypothetical protein EOP06_18800 [Pseudomonadota bacterium]